LSFAKATAKATGKDQRSVQRDRRRGKVIPTEVLSTVIGTSLDKGDELDALASQPPDRRNRPAAKAASGERVSAKIELKKAKRTDRERELGAKQRALPDQKFGVIYADPEWQFDPWSRETGMDRAADNHYPTSTLQVIKSRPVEKIAAKDCVLFMWATAPMEDQAHQVMVAWGFAYVTQVMWRKIRRGNATGTGYWFTNEHEILLVGTRGNVPAPAPGTQWPSVIEAPVGEYSEKPAIFAKLIEEYFPNLLKIELNRRGPPRPGWSSWGLEAEEGTPDTD
jgi:N6-adenosine-specific RNA methylase IME4